MTNKPLRTLLSTALALVLLLLPAALAESGAFPESAVIQIGRPEALGSLLPGWHSYASSCSAIVTFDESGTLFAHHSGSAVVTAENASGQTASCAVTVEPPVFYARFPALADEETADAPYAVDAFNLSGEEQTCLYAFSAPEEGWYDALASGAVGGLSAYLWDAEDYLTLESLPANEQTQDRTLRVFLKQNATLFFCLMATPGETGYSLSVCRSPETEETSTAQLRRYSG